MFDSGYLLAYIIFAIRFFVGFQAVRMDENSINLAASNLNYASDFVWFEALNIDCLRLWAKPSRKNISVESCDTSVAVQV